MISRNPENSNTLLVRSCTPDPLVDRLELLQLELTELTAEREDLHRLVNEFEIQYHQRLGQHIGRILELRRNRAQKLAESHSEFESRYQETQHDYNSWHQSSSRIKNKKLFSLTDEDLKVLKRTFRKAAGKCHPDVARGEDKERSKEFFISLRQAYERNDLDAVIDLAEQIESEHILSHDAKKAERESLNNAIATLEQKLILLQSEIKKITESESYRVLAVYSDVAIYFEEREKELLLQITELEQYVRVDL